MLSIRNMSSEDVEQAAALEAEVFTLPWTAQDFAQALCCGYAYYLVAEEEEYLLGICGLRNIVGEGEITNVAVRQSRRNMGIGRAMMEGLLQRGLEEGIKAFTLEVRESNEAAIRLYETLGFRTEGIRRSFYERPVENAVIMWKR